MLKRIHNIERPRLTGRQLPAAIGNTAPGPQMKFGSKLAFTIMMVHILFVATFPNAMQEIKFASYAASGIAMVFCLGRNAAYIAKLLGASFLMFHGIGILHGYSEVGLTFVPYVAAAYLCGPVYWFLLFSALFALTTAERLKKVLLVAYALAATEIILFSVFYDSIPIAVKELLIQDPNKSVMDGVSVVRIHATGSLIFLFPFMLVSLKKTKYLYPLLAALGIVASVLTGRTGLIVGVIGSVLVVSVLQQRYTALLAILGGVLLIVASNSIGLFENDLSWANIAEDHISKLVTKGGDERPEQRLELLRGFLDAPLFGNGHGVTTQVLRDTEKPWRYELFYEATLFRVGLFGFLATIAPIVWAGIVLFRHIRHISGDYLGNGVFAGMISLLIASGTNPYFEAIDFQWMVMLPIAYASLCVSMVTSRQRREMRAKSLAPVN